MRTILSKELIMAKTATFGVMHVITAFSVTYAMTGSLTIAGVVTFVEPLVNTVMHYFFDKYWDHPKVQAIRSAVAGAVKGEGVGQAAPASAEVP
jgi:uncharacterized membrane protein